MMRRQSAVIATSRTGPLEARERAEIGTEGVERLPRFLDVVAVFLLGWRVLSRPASATVGKLRRRHAAAE